MIELDARLDDGRDDAVPGAREPRLVEDVAVHGEGVERRRRGGHRKLSEVLVSAARHRDLGADDVARRLGGVARKCVFGGPAEPRRALGDGAFGKRHRIAGAAHRAVEVDFAEAGTDVIGDHDLGPGHGLVGRPARPGIGAEMIAAERDPIGRDADAVGDDPDEVAEGSRGHAGVAAVLIDLVRGRLDQHKGRGVLRGVPESRLNHQWMGGADGSDADALAHFVPGDDVADDLHACSLVLPQLYGEVTRNARKRYVMKFMRRPGGTRRQRSRRRRPVRSPAGLTRRGQGRGR